MNKLVSNAWVWFAVWCVALFFVTQLALGWAVRWAVGASNVTNDTVQIEKGSDLVDLWSKDSYAVQQTKAVLSPVQPAEQVLIANPPILAPGLVRVQ